MYHTRNRNCTRIRLRPGRTLHDRLFPAQSALRTQNHHLTGPQKQARSLTKSFLDLPRQLLQLHHLLPRSTRSRVPVGRPRGPSHQFWTDFSERASYGIFNILQSETTRKRRYFINNLGYKSVSLMMGLRDSESIL